VIAHTLEYWFRIWFRLVVDGLRRPYLQDTCSAQYLYRPLLGQWNIEDRRRTFATAAGVDEHHWVVALISIMCMLVHFSQLDAVCHTVADLIPVCNMLHASLSSVAVISGRSSALRMLKEACLQARCNFGRDGDIRFE
jgi:hypothetical protein